MLIPADPEERGRLWMTMLEMVKAELKSGALTDWGMCSDSSAGYAFAETDEQSLHVMIQNWMPYVIFNIKPVLTAEQCIADIQQAAAAAKK